MNSHHNWLSHDTFDAVCATACLWSSQYFYDDMQNTNTVNWCHAASSKQLFMQAYVYNAIIDS